MNTVVFLAVFAWLMAVGRCSEGESSNSSLSNQVAAGRAPTVAADYAFDVISDRRKLLGMQFADGTPKFATLDDFRKAFRRLVGEIAPSLYDYFFPGAVSCRYNVSSVSRIGHPQGHEMSCQVHDGINDFTLHATHDPGTASHSSSTSGDNTVNGAVPEKITVAIWYGNEKIASYRVTENPQSTIDKGFVPDSGYEFRVKLLQGGR